MPTLDSTGTVTGVRPPTASRPPAAACRALRPLARRVHFLAGILVAPFVLVLSLTGLLYVFSPQVHDSLYAQQLYVHHMGEVARPVSEQVSAAMAAHPEARLRSVVPPADPERTTRVNLTVPGLTTNGEARTVFVDPYTNYISGELTTVNDRLPANQWLRDLHGNLHLGEVGRLYAKTAASWLPVIVLSGVLLWVAKQGRRRRTARELLVPAARGKGTQTRLRSVHGPLGLWLTIGLLVMSVTGLSMGPPVDWGVLDARAPTLPLVTVDVPADDPPVGVDQVLRTAEAAGLRGELQVTPPASMGGPYVVAERSRGLPVQRDAIAVHPYTGSVLERIGWDDYPMLAKLRTLGIEAHTGTLFGLANQILLALLAIGTIVLVVVGYWMWAKRSPYRGKLPPAPLPAFRQLSWPVRIGVGLVTAVLGYLLPAFGISLVAFVAVDVAITIVRSRRIPVRRERVTLPKQEQHTTP